MKVLSLGVLVPAKRVDLVVVLKAIQALDFMDPLYSVGAIEIKVGFARENKGRQYSQLTSGFFKQVVAKKAEHISQLVVLRQDRDLAQDSMRSQSLREIVTGSL